MDAAVWHLTVFTHYRDRRLEASVACAFLSSLMARKPVKQILSSDHFCVDGTLIEACGSMERFRSKNGPSEPPGLGRTSERDFCKEKCSNRAHTTTSDPGVYLYRKGTDRENQLSNLGHTRMENRNEHALDTARSHAPTLPRATLP